MEIQLNIKCNFDEDANLWSIDNDGDILVDLTDSEALTVLFRIARTTIMQRR